MILIILLLLTLFFFESGTTYKLIPGIFHKNMYYSNKKLNRQDKLCVKEVSENFNSLSRYTGLNLHILDDCFFCNELNYIPSNSNSFGYSVISGNFNGKDWLLTDCNISIKKNLHINTCYNIMLHEIGHCFGLDHSDDKHSIMGSHVSINSEGNVIAHNKVYYNWDDFLGFVNKH